MGCANTARNTKNKRRCTPGHSIGVRLIYNEFMQTVNIIRYIKVVLSLFVHVACNVLAEESFQLTLLKQPPK
jgi:hypothetical protein